jgi:hypothetical protein
VNKNKILKYDQLTQQNRNKKVQFNCGFRKSFKEVVALCHLNKMAAHLGNNYMPAK